MKRSFNVIACCAISLFFLINSFNSFGQSEKMVTYNLNEVSKATVEAFGPIQISTTKAKYFQIDVNSLSSQLAGIMHREDPTIGFVANLQLPHPDGSLHNYRAKENGTMDKALALQFPEIKTFDAGGVENGAVVKWDITPKGLHAMIMIPGESTIFIDPAIAGNKDYYIVYHKKDFYTSKSFDCSFTSEDNDFENPYKGGTLKMFGTCQLRTYRLAVSATGEYTTFHGGTVALALAAQVTSVNRVSGVFEKDMAITLVLIANNSSIIYTNSGTDPFTNGTPGTMINENQTNTDAVIGSANYDMGHVFGTNSGGLAGLGVVCTNTQKARGVTGSSAPIGDPFDIDYVVHEMGHQFGANHTQNNNCNRNLATAVEPGSASTIMGYAGICAPNVQNNSDDHFSGRSLEEIGIEILSAGHTCEQITALTNSAPILSSTNGNVTVPANTPFALTAIATDADGDPITYNWEQMDNEVSTQPPVGTSTGGPNFRSNPSSLNPTRYFPSLSSLATNGPYTWEVLPTVTRTMDFRVTLRDNSPGPGGCNDHGNVTITTDAGSGPFLVVYPSATGISWAGTSTQTVTWSVANTNNTPVACANVDVLLSVDGGLTYPYTLATNVPNDGSQLITVPNLPTTTARIMVICSNGTFFDISNNNFTITAATYDYTLAVTPSTLTVCQPNDAVFNINIGSIGGYIDPVTLSVTGVPAGATSNFSVNPVTPAGASVLTISNTLSAAPGVYSLTVSGNSTSGINSQPVTLTILSGTPTAPTLIAPANGATGITVPTTMSWNAVLGSGVTYNIQISTDPGFATIVDQATGISVTNFTSSLLLPNITYYWHVNATTSCGTSSYSTPFMYTINGCSIYTSTNVPITISSSGTPTITSTITVPAGGTINDVNVLNLFGTHTRISDLVITLTGPTGVTVTLMNQVCNVQDNFDINFDNAGALYSAIPCPPIDGNAYQSFATLTAFNGLDAAGVWTLTVSDAQNTQGGVLQGWSLEICVNPPSGCIAASLPILSFTPATVCAGQSTSLNITGNLNNATAWYVYSGSCGGTLVGTTATSSFAIPSASTLTYFVRGEDGVGCLNEATTSCSQISLTPNPIPTAPVASVVNGCGSSILSATGTNLLWSNTQTVSPITVTTGGLYTVTQTVGGCTSVSSSVTAAPLIVPSVPVVSATDNCGNSTLTATGSNLLWSNGATTSPTTVTTAGTYTVTQNNGSCTSLPATISANPLLVPSAPTVVVTNNCGNSVLTASGSNLLWSTSATTASITVTSSGTYTVTQTVGSCTSLPATGIASPLISPVIALGTLTNPSACGVNDGSIVISGSGTGVITWTGPSPGSISNSSWPYTISGLLAGAYSISYNNGCPSNNLSSSLTDVSAPASPSMTILNNCGNSVITAVGSNLLWSTGATTNSITVTSAGIYTVTQSISGCTSAPSTITAAPLVVPTAPVTSVVNGCGSSILTASGSNLLWSTSETTSSISVTSAASYTVTQSNGTCVSSSSSVTANPISIPSIPLINVVMGCNSATLSSTGSNLLWSTGATTASITVTVGGTYTLSQTVNGCTSLLASQTVTMGSTLPAPNTSVANNCGSSILTASASGNVLWSTGETTLSIIVTSPGIYTVVETQGTCVSATASVTAAPLGIPSTPIVTVIDNCGSSILSTTATGSLMWSTSETTPTISVSTSGTYFVSQTISGCTSAVGTIVANPLSNPNVTFAPLSDVCINTPIFALTGGLPVGGTYTGTGVNANQFDASVSGYGTFTIDYSFVDVNGCAGSNQQPITVGCLGIDDLEANTLVIYPNPSSGKFSIITTGESVISVLIHDATGRLVEIVENKLNANELNIDMTNYAQGVYSLDISTGATYTVHRLILTK